MTVRPRMSDTSNEGGIRMNEKKQRPARPYYVCASYPNRLHAGNAKTVIWAIGIVDKISISCFSVSNGKTFFLVVVGDEPSKRTKLRILEALSSGRLVNLQSEVVEKFVKRHKERIANQGNP